MYLQLTLFNINPSGAVLVLVYSSYVSVGIRILGKEVTFCLLK
ncbi:hypothetical protein DCCM_2119 [Desulfocucumis palustris]|uniref:Uncharacterized protein n=1 Tax=Desulfocucumis palustris TaxID=1898651 RepID=A0A2L2XAE1_9FIRM|nr:hypothetical protein DCCM_2119 [Desulfocucumis palustris]